MNAALEGAKIHPTLANASMCSGHTSIASLAAEAGRAASGLSALDASHSDQHHGDQENEHDSSDSEPASPKYDINLQQRNWHPFFNNTTRFGRPGMSGPAASTLSVPQTPRSQSVNPNSSTLSLPGTSTSTLLHQHLRLLQVSPQSMIHSAHSGYIYVLHGNLAQPFRWRFRKAKRGREKLWNSDVLCLSMIDTDLYTCCANGWIQRWSAQFACTASWKTHEGIILSSIIASASSIANTSSGRMITSGYEEGESDREDTNGDEEDKHDKGWYLVTGANDNDIKVYSHSHLLHYHITYSISFDDRSGPSTSPQRDTNINRTTRTPLILTPTPTRHTPPLPPLPTTTGTNGYISQDAETGEVNNIPFPSNITEDDENR
ncbi:hypothetical protein M422DRAFT_264420 [Sphaerobolus stellatus SS14]|uniref:Uncharacterized protein n=1 Tax=Sphaerobolus stellatus (strain SS14) TaxID=990650 RepID=A0A0C9UFR9_SPHS4|nr:hypothetical protein M422DRAFT_264420 [Sphaerobolus stellatus SS14]